MALNFDKYAREGNLFVSRLAEGLGHPDEPARTGILLRAVLHTLRDRITIAESINLLAQLPAFLKVVYVDNWKYQQHPDSYKDKEHFFGKVKENQRIYGETDFDWNKSTEELVSTVLIAVSQYVSKGELDDVIDQLPQDVKEFFEEKVIL